MRKQKSLRQLAGELGVSASYLGMIKSGQRKCPSDLMEKLEGCEHFVHSLKLESWSGRRDSNQRHPDCKLMTHNVEAAATV
jgi:transcriptional regulator with XRE-family HTH domain